MKKIITLFVALMALGAMNAQTDLIISEYVEGWSNNKAIEIYNPTSSSINISAYKLVRYSNGSDVPPSTSAISITLPDFALEPYKAYVIVLDKRNASGTGQEAPIWSQLEARADAFLCPDYNVSKTMYFNGDDAISLEKLDGTLVCLFARWGAPRASALGGWTEDSSQGFLNGVVAVTKDHTLVRKSSIKDGITVNPNLFNALAEYDSLSANTFTELGWHKFDGAPSNTVPTINMKDLYAVSPLAAVGDEVVTISATDDDVDQTLEYYIVSGNFVYVGEGDDAVRHTPFSIDKSTGKITVADETAIVEAVEDIYMNIAVCDEYGQSEIFYFNIRVTDDPLAINDNMVLDITLSPNPAKDFIIVKANDVMSRICVYSIVGKEVFNKVCQSKTEKVSIDFESGSYLVKTEFSNGKVGVQKLIVE